MRKIIENMYSAWDKDSSYISFLLEKKKLLSAI